MKIMHILDKIRKCGIIALRSNKFNHTNLHNALPALFLGPSLQSAEPTGTNIPFIHVSLPWRPEISYLYIPDVNPYPAVTENDKSSSPV